MPDWLKFPKESFEQELNLKMNIYVFRLIKSSVGIYSKILKHDNKNEKSSIFPDGLHCHTLELSQLVCFQLQRPSD